jgi:hypothetical protein
LDGAVRHVDRWVLHVRDTSVVVAASDGGRFRLELSDGTVFEGTADVVLSAGPVRAPGVAVLDQGSWEFLGGQRPLSWVVFDRGSVRIVFGNGWHVNVRIVDGRGWVLSRGGQTLSRMP